MSRSLALAVLGLGLLAVGMLRADAAAPASSRVAYVDLQKTLNSTRVGKKARKELEKYKDNKQKELDGKQKELQEFAAELDKQRAVLKPNVLRQREQELQQKYIQLQEYFMTQQQELARREAKVVQEIFVQAAPHIEAIAKRAGYEVVLEKTESAVLWAQPTSEITVEVNKMLDGGK